MPSPRTAAALLGAVLASSSFVNPPAHAAAGIRYASPTGTSGQDCLTPATACSIDKAVDDALAGDEVIVAAGNYTVDGLSNSVQDLEVHGADPDARPVITVTSFNGVFLGGTAARVSDLEFVHTGAGVGLVVTNSGSVVERVKVTSGGNGACAASYLGVQRDSLCLATGTNGSGVRLQVGSSGTSNGQMRNVTAIGTGASGKGIELVVTGSGFTQNLDIRNVIAQGATDIRVTAAEGATASITATASNYETLSVSGPGTTIVTSPGSGTNQTAAPVFADTTAYHQSPSSPTVDAGSVDSLVGTSDLDGDARLTGSAPDIGVDEYVDDLAPQTTIKKKPNKETFARTAKFTFTSSEAGSGFRCKLDQAKTKPCTSPYRRTKLKPGKHTFKVWAVDAAGNTDPKPAKYSWKIKRRPI